MGYFFSLASLSKSSTETALDGSEIFIIISGFVLAFGAIGEYLDEHGKLPRWMAWRKLVFIILVVVSLIGEFVGDAGVFVFSRHLQTISDDELAKVIKDARDANSLAATAFGRAESAIARLDPRVNFTFKFLYELSGAPKAKAVVWYAPSHDAGALFLAMTIRNLLASGDPSGAGWEVAEPAPIPVGRDPNLGDVGVVKSSRLPLVCQKVPPNPCAALIAALSVSLTTGINVAQSADLPEDTFWIVVKQRPPASPAPFGPIPFSPGKGP